MPMILAYDLDFAIPCWCFSDIRRVAVSLRGRAEPPCCKATGSVQFKLWTYVKMQQAWKMWITVNLNYLLSLFPADFALVHGPATSQHVQHFSVLSTRPKACVDAPALADLSRPHFCGWEVQFDPIRAKVRWQWPEIEEVHSISVRFTSPARQGKIWKNKVFKKTGHWFRLHARTLS